MMDVVEIVMRLNDNYIGFVIFPLPIYKGDFAKFSLETSSPL